MKGTRPLDNNEIRLVSACFDGAFEVRNRGLFLIGVSTGGRISELLSLQIGEVWQNQQPVSDLLFDKKIVKGGEVSRAVPVNSDGRNAIEATIGWHQQRYNNTDADRPLFPSRNGRGAKRMSRRTAHDVLKKAFIAAGLNGHLATHSLRKSFAQRLYERTGDIFAVQEMLGHRNVATTQKYLGVNYASVRQAVEEMSLSGELHRSFLLGSSLKSEKDETLFLELALRGYDLGTLRQDDAATETAAEIVSFGE
ncbi:phage integrase family protein [Candidatus Poribacteria bacterium]|nr:phage integrase family protein [Candidatus Poribacteria bacterium]MYA99389.1 phage integrase family protein [Candidatus Poribacteria bacterium]MYI35257.1 phage integrase family protein [Acidimicrobiaceae bacterium]